MRPHEAFTFVRPHEPLTFNFGPRFDVQIDSSAHNVAFSYVWIQNYGSTSYMIILSIYRAVGK